MSDEFIRIARKEIQEELASLKALSDSCLNDSDLEKKSIEVEKHLHKIKGLAPMMGKQNLGTVASILDSLFKKIIDNTKMPGILNAYRESLDFMLKNIRHEENGFDKIYELLTTSFSNHLDNSDF